MGDGVVVTRCGRHGLPRRFGRHRPLARARLALGRLVADCTVLAGTGAVAGRAERVSRFAGRTAATTPATAASSPAAPLSAPTGAIHTLRGAFHACGFHVPLRRTCRSGLAVRVSLARDFGRCRARTLPRAVAVAVTVTIAALAASLTLPAVTITTATWAA